jgi:hypothetical protein
MSARFLIAPKEAPHRLGIRELVAAYAHCVEHRPRLEEFPGRQFVRGHLGRVLLGMLLGLSLTGTCRGQCSSVASTPQAAADCAARATPESKIASLDASHAYSLAELIDIGEHNNPAARIAWERAKQRAESLGIAKSEYFPVLAGIAAFGDSRSIRTGE